MEYVVLKDKTTRTQRTGKRNRLLSQCLNLKNQEELAKCHLTAAAGRCVYSGLSISTRLLISGATSSFGPNPRLSLASPAVCADWRVSAAWHAEHSGYTRRSRPSCSRCRRTSWPEPPPCSWDVCPGSFRLWEERLCGKKRKRLHTYMHTYILWSHSHTHLLLVDCRV